MNKAKRRILELGELTKAKKLEVANSLKNGGRVSRERLQRKVKALQNIYNRNNVGYSFLCEAKKELADFEANYLK